MGIKFNDFKTKGIDVSAFNGAIDWKEVKCDFCAIRAGYGKTTDARFIENWKNSKGKVFRFVYWYEDYYSNWYNKNSSVYGLSDENWGKYQAEYCWNLFKDDPESGIVFLDIENGGSSYSKPLTSDPESKKHAQQIARAFLTRMDELNRKFNGIYCSLALLTWFGDWFKNRPLWVAWYNESKSISTVLKNVSAYGWKGMCHIWQYASDGDMNDDGFGDGTLLGMDYNWLDLNAYIQSEEEYKKFTGGFIADDNNPIPEDDNTKYITTALLGLWIRKEPNAQSLKLGSFKYNTTVNILSIDSGGWGKLADRDGYICMKYTRKVE